MERGFPDKTFEALLNRNKNHENFFKKERKFKKEEENWWLNMDIYWKLAVLLMFLGTVLAFFFGYRLFIEINKEPCCIFQRRKQPNRNGEKRND